MSSLAKHRHLSTLMASAEQAAPLLHKLNSVHVELSALNPDFLNGIRRVRDDD